MSANNSSVYLPIRREAISLIAMHTCTDVNCIESRLGTLEWLNVGLLRTVAHYVIPTSDCECHTMTDEVRIRVYRHICRGVVAICIPT